MQMNLKHNFDQVVYYLKEFDIHVFELVYWKKFLWKFLKTKLVEVWKIVMQLWLLQVLIKIFLNLRLCVKVIVILEKQ